MAIPDEAFERILQEAVIRPAGRRFRGEPARQVEILRVLRRRDEPVPFDRLHRHLRERGILRSERDDDLARRKAIAQAVDAINVKLGTFFFHTGDAGLLGEMFRIRVHRDDPSRPSYSLQDFFDVRRLSGVRSYATTDEPAGGLTRELFEIVTEIRPDRIDMMAPALESFLGNPEVRSMIVRGLSAPPRESLAARARVLLLDPRSPEAARLEKLERREWPVLGPLRDRIHASLSHAAEIISGLSGAARDRFSVRVSTEAPLWRFRMIFLPDVLHLRLSPPGGNQQTLIKLAAGSALYTSLHDVFEGVWDRADDVS